MDSRENQRDMENHVSIDITPRSRSKPSCHSMLSDFANMVKAFIGSNYLSIAYAFTQSGLVLGVIVLFIIAAVTDHCCHMIINCKYHCINHVIRKHKQLHGKASKNSVNSSNNSLLSSDESDQNEDEDFNEELKEIRKQMTRNFTYGDAGRLSFGSKGLFLVNMCLLLTQFGFCISYFIFIGNTIFSIFPYRNTTLDLQGEKGVEDDEEFYRALRSVNQTVSSFFGQNVSNTTTVSPSINSTLPFDDIASTLPSIVPQVNISDFVDRSLAPDLRLLVITPLPIFIGFAFLRDVRHLGFVSVGANISIFIGCIVTVGYLVAGFSLSDTWVMADFMKVAVFFGMATSAFEGIGTIIPIECSMEGNRHNFGKFLHGAVAILFFILVIFGVMGYLRFGAGTEQMINKNIPSGTPLAMATNICLSIGVILTFPLQIYPVIEITEIYVFGTGRICGPKNDDDEDDERGETSDARDALLPKKEVEMPVAVATKISDDVSTWKRNFVRMFLVIAAAGLAVLMKDFYAYVSAFVGAIGSSMLAYILPCLFHLKLQWHEMGLGIKIKDIVIIIFGFGASSVSLYSTISEVVRKF